jgi:hypothetical protein
LFHADIHTYGQTDMTKLIVVFCYFVSAPKMYSFLRIKVLFQNMKPLDCNIVLVIYYMGESVTIFGLYFGLKL